MAGINDEKFRKMQDEMSRFEEEIGLPLPDVVPLPPDKPMEGLIPPPLPSGSLQPPPLPSLPPPPPPGPRPPGMMPPGPPGMMPPGMMSGPPGMMSGPPGMMTGPPGMMHHGPPMMQQGPPGPPMMQQGHPGPPMMQQGPPGPPMMQQGPPGPPMMQQGHPGPPMMQQGPPGPPMMQQGPPGPPMFGSNPHMPPQMMQQQGPPMHGPPMPPMGMPQMPPQFSGGFPGPMGPPLRQQEPKGPGPVVLSSTPMLYVANPQIDIAAMQVEQVSTPTRTSEPAMHQPVVQEKKKKLEKPIVVVTTEPVLVQSKKKEKKNRKLMRTAGGHTWEDPTLGEWDDDDFRLFCGDLGNDVTDEVLSRAFSKYNSFVKAKVVRDKRTNKTKGFGFVSFKDPHDFIKATKEMNGRYVGSRPIKLRKSTWKNRSLDVVRKKDKEKVALINMLTGK